MWYVAEENIYQIVAGERRYRAAVAAGLQSIPCLVEDVPASQPVLSRVEILVEQISENWQRADLQPLELSSALAELGEALQLGPRELARRVAKPESEVSRLLSLQKIAPDLREEIRQASETPLTRRHLIAVAQLPAEAHRAFTDRIKSEKLTAMAAEREAARMRGKSVSRKQRRSQSALRRFLIGNATVEVRFRKHDATDEEVLSVLERAVEIVRSQSKPS